MKRSLASFVLVIAAACSAAPPPAEQGPTSNATLFEGARLITGDGSTPVEDSAILIEGDQISRVGRKGEIQLPAGAQRVDLTGKTIYPGWRYAPLPKSPRYVTPTPPLLNMPGGKQA